MSDKSKSHKSSMPAATELQEQLDELKSQIAQLTDALQRERADAINLRRRYEDQLAGVRDQAKSGIITALLPAIDNFERSLRHIPKDLESNDYIKGVSNVVKQFEHTLESLGVRRVETVGKDFNPELHEAVSLEDGEGTKEIVIEEIQPGYQLNGNVIRHALVKVRPEK